MMSKSLTNIDAQIEAYYEENPLIICTGEEGWCPRCDFKDTEKCWMSWCAKAKEDDVV